MKWNYISMIFYFCASAFLIAFAFTSSNIWLGCGVISLALAVISIIRSPFMPCGFIFCRKPHF